MGIAEEIRRAVQDAGGWLLGGFSGRMFYLYRTAQRTGGRFWTWALIPEIMIGFGMGYLGATLIEALGYPGLTNGAAGVAGWLGTTGAEHCGKRLLDRFSSK